MIASSSPAQACFYAAGEASAARQCLTRFTRCTVVSASGSVGVSGTLTTPLLVRLARHHLPLPWVGPDLHLTAAQNSKLSSRHPCLGLVLVLLLHNQLHDLVFQPGVLRDQIPAICVKHCLSSVRQATVSQDQRLMYWCQGSSHTAPLSCFSYTPLKIPVPVHGPALRRQS